VERRSDLKRIILILSPLVFIVVLALGLLKFFHPEIESFLIRQIRSLSAKHSPVEVSAEHINIGFFPPSVEVTGMEIDAGDAEKMGFSVVEVDSAVAELDLLQLLVGRLAISTLKLTSLDIELNLDTELSQAGTTKKPALNLDAIFDKLKIIPIHRLLLVDFAAKISSKKLNFDVHLDESNALFVNEGNSIAVEADIDSSEAHFQKLKESSHLRLGLVLNRTQVDIPQFHLTTAKTDTQAHITISNLENISTGLNAKLSLVTNSDLHGLHELLAMEFKVPPLEGHARLSADLRIEKGILRNGDLEVHTEALQIDGFDVGAVDLVGDWKENSFHSKKFQVDNRSGLISLPNFELSYKKADDSADSSSAKPFITMKTELDSDLLDLNELLQALKVGEIPVELITAGHFQCGGPLYPDFSLTCQGGTDAILFEARSENQSRQVIAGLGEFAVSGTVNIDAHRVQFQSKLKIGKDEGTSDGVISYADGFKINYDTPSMDFSNIDELANLKLEGKAKLSGQVSGGTKHAEFFIDTDAQNIWFEDFFLGNPKMKIRYLLGNLSFENVVSNINASRFTAEVQVNLPEKHLDVTADCKDADVSDGVFALQRRLKIPVELTGVGQVHARASGPLDISHLSYDVKALIERGSAAGEGFDSLDVNVVSQQGEVEAKKFIMKKGQGTIVGKGQGHPDGSIAFLFEGRNLLLEESENVARLGSSISGQWSFDMLLKGPIRHPEVSLNTEVHNLVIEEQDFAPSAIQSKFTTHGAQVQASLFGGKLKADLLWPFSANDPFRLEASARDWNYTTMTTLIGGGSLLSDYHASLTGDVKLTAEKGGFFASTGEATIMKAQIRRGNLELQNPGPMEFKMNKGVLSLNNFRLSGENSYLEFSSTASTRENLAIKARGHVPLHIFQIFFPFIEELSGINDLQADITGSLDHPEILGNATLENGFVKLKAFPHAFERLNAKAQFSQTKVLITDVNGNLAGGTFSGDGTVSIVGLNELPINFHAHLDNATLNVPEGVRTTGYGDFAFSGSWFPFTLSGTYHVTSGLITKEFESDGNQKNAKLSSYLPKIFLQTAFDPLQLNLQIIFDQPIAIKNSLIDGSLNGSLNILGPASLPTMTGKVSLEKSSKIAFRDKMFNVATATATFNDPKEINPDLYIAAQSHVQDYDVNLTIQGTAKNPVIRLSSQPPLAEQDIVSLLALGMTTGNQDDKGGLQQRDVSANMYTQAGAALFNQISKDAQKALDVDLQIASQYDDTKNLAVQKYTLSRKVTDKIAFSSILTRGDESSEAFLVKYSLNPELSISASVEDVESVQTQNSSATQPTGQILGLDLEYKQEFKWHH
jgi:translocation and assembly module TamB